MLRTLWVWGLVLCWACPAWAQADSAQERAKKFFIQGSQDYKAKRYARALDAFEQANAIKPHPIMLKNIARTYEAMKDLTRAVDYYQQYVATKPADQGEIEQKLAALRSSMAKWSRVTLTTTPAGAAIWVGPRTNRPRGKTPETLVIEPGAQTITVALAGYQIVEKRLNLQAGQALSLPPITLQKLRPQVRLASDPAGASVYVDGSETPAGRTPLTLQLAAGEHQLRFELDGHRTFKQSVTLAEAHIQTPMRTAVKLEVGKPTGELVIELSKGEVFVDGKSVGKAPLSAPIELEEGMHAIEVRGGDEPYREMVTIKGGEQTRTAIDLGDSGPGLSISQDTVGWILMGTGGALVVGGVITSFLALGADGDLQDCRDDPACAFTDREVALADDVRSSALTTDILLGVGVAVAATGTVLYLMADDDQPARKTATGVPSVGVTPLRGGGAAAFGVIEF